EVSDVGTQQSFYSRTVRIGAIVERPGVNRIVRFASEVEIMDEQLANVLGALDVARRIVIKVLDVPSPHLTEIRKDRAMVKARRELLTAESLEQLVHQLSIEIGGIHLLESLPTPLLPVPDQIGVQTARPSDAAFEKGEFEGREATSDAAQEQALGNCLARNGEVPDMIVSEVGG